MSKFILAHDATNNASTVLINVNVINYADESNWYTGATRINTDYGDFHVTETREKILEMLQS